MATDTTSEPVPAATPSDPTAPTIARRTYDDLARELIEFEKRFEPPDANEIRADARWFVEHRGAPDFEPYRGTHVVILNGAVVGHGWNSLQLQLDAARKFNIHPQRFIVEYIPAREF